MTMKRRGFTIIELLMVIGVLSVLITITSVTVIGALKRARVQRANVLCALVKQGLSTYCAQKGSWPWGEISEGDSDDGGWYTLRAKEVKDAIYQLVVASKVHNPMMDISGLYVYCSKKEHANAGAPKTTFYGMDFMTAVRGSKKNPNKTPASKLVYGYPEESHGYFRRFVIKYHPKLDTIMVRKFTAEEEKKGETLAEGAE